MLGLFIIGVLVASLPSPVLAQEPAACSGDDCKPLRPRNPFDITLSGFYRFSSEVDRGNFGFGTLVGIGGHVIPQYAVQFLAGLEFVRYATTASMLGFGLRRDNADGEAMVRIGVSAYMQHPEDSEYLPGFARRSVKLGMQARIDVLFSVASAFVGFGFSNVIIDGDILLSLGVLVAIE